MERTAVNKLEEATSLIEVPQTIQLDYAPVKKSKARKYLIAGAITFSFLAGAVAYKLLNDYVNSVNGAINDAIGKSFSF